MFIFYDFETSSRDLLGQILNYAFVITTPQLEPVSELSGYIRLNRTQLPEIEAILVNKLNVEWLQANGENEWDSAKKIFDFLSNAITQYGPCTLAGFNSNHFDLGFLRNLLIGYGYNPYFEGKLGNKDVLHFAQHLAFQNPSLFPWIRIRDNYKSYYSFKLEDLASSLSLLDSAQTHDAKDDVFLTIMLTQTLQRIFDTTFRAFNPFQIHLPTDSQLRYRIGTVKQRDFAQGETELAYFKQVPMLLLARDKKTALCINLDKYQQLKQVGYPLSDEQKLSCIQYVNENKHFFILNPLSQSPSDYFEELADDIFKDAYFLNFSKQPTLYFDAIKKPWDIAYQIHELGFDHIPLLRDAISELLQHPDSYKTRLDSLLAKRKTPKDTYLIQLYNRAYMNSHPNPDPALLKRYLDARYVTGTLLKNPDELVSLTSQKDALYLRLESTKSEQEQDILFALYNYYTLFLDSLL